MYMPDTYIPPHTCYRGLSQELRGVVTRATYNVWMDMGGGDGICVE